MVAIKRMMDARGRESFLEAVKVDDGRGEGG